MKSIRKSEDFVRTIGLLIEEGLTRKQIADRLKTTPNTVEKAVVAINKGFNTIAEYLDSFARSNGFTSFIHYKRCMEVLAKNNEDRSLDYRPKSKQEIFEDSLQTRSNEELEKIVQRGLGKIYCLKETPQVPSEKNILERMTTLREIRRLTPKQQDVINGVFYRGMSCSELAEESGSSRQAVNERLEQALIKLKRYIQKEPRKLTKIEDGEIILAYIIARTPLKNKWGYAAKLINELFHNGEEIRNKNALRKRLHLRQYKRRMQELREKYF